MSGRIQSVLEQMDKKLQIERTEEFIFTPLLFAPFHFITKIIGLSIQETFFLNEIAEHQTVEHHRSVPLLVSVLFQIRDVIINTRDKLGKGVVLFFETSIKVLGHLLTVDGKSALDAFLYVYDCCDFCIIKRQVIYLRKDKVCLISSFIFDSDQVTLFHLAYRRHPLMMFCASQYIDGYIVIGTAAQFSVYALADGGCGYRFYFALQYLESTSLSNGIKLIICFINGNQRKFLLTFIIIPSHFSDKQFFVIRFTYMVQKYILSHIIIS